MKRKIALGMIFVILSYCIILTAPTSATLPNPEIMVPQVITCEPSCGPYVARCSDVEIVDDGEHSVLLGGYPKTCSYNIYSAYTVYRCIYCNSTTVGGTHSHGEDGHTYPSNCGGSNKKVCAVDGFEYNGFIEVLPLE